MAKKLNLNADDVAEILKHKPSSERKTASELAEQYSISQATVRNIWRLGGLPSKKDKSPRSSNVSIAIMTKIAKEKGQDLKTVADNYNVKTTLVKKIWSTIS